MNIRVVDGGHVYVLPYIDGPGAGLLTFVKRHDPEKPWRFPGNHESYPGTTLQCVLRALVNRVRYLQNQIWSPENAAILFCLKSCLWLLEFRAARRHGRKYFHGFVFAEKAVMCDTCGHTVCEHKNNV